MNGKAALDAGQYKDIAALLAKQPLEEKDYETPSEYRAARATWLFAMADALHDIGLDEDAESMQDAAMGLVREAAEQVSEGTTVAPGVLL
ncbi:hypothetical protein [Amycolatopsis sp. NPDC054798]